MKKLFKRSLAFVAVLYTVTALGGTVTVKGSDTLVILAQKWAEVYMNNHTEVKIQVTGGGSGIGFAAWQNDTTDIADASRPMKPPERAACIRRCATSPREHTQALAAPSSNA